MKVVTCLSPTNIAIIKYWGKENPVLNTPLNSSVSVTLDPTLLYAKTSIAVDQSFSATRMWLNGKELSQLPSRAIAVIELLKSLSGDPKCRKMHFHIVSENSFPTGAGLASSAAGYASLVYTLAQILDLHIPLEELSVIARQGSGSACRSLFGGLVRWDKGTDSASSKAIHIADETSWPELCAVICVVNEKEKETSSTFGMQLSKRTSALLPFRTSKSKWDASVPCVSHSVPVVPERIEAMQSAFLEKNFTQFGRILMQDSNQFHAICLDTQPPIFYMNATSQHIISLIHAYNNISEDGEIRAAYTFDAGPNAVVYTTRAYLEELVQLLQLVYSDLKNIPFEASLSLHFQSNSKALRPQVRQLGDSMRNPSLRKGIRRLYISCVGSGPVILDPTESLIDVRNGLPRKLPLKERGTHSMGTRRSAFSIGLGAVVALAIIGSFFMRK